MSQVQIHLERPEEEAEEAFELHAGEIVAGEIIDELEDVELEKEEALEAELEEEHGVVAVDEAEQAGEAVEAADTDEVEAGLDQLLLLRTLGEDELADATAWAVVTADDDVIVPRRHRGEFLCRGCFLVKSRCQLADTHRHLCRDCV